MKRRHSTDDDEGVCVCEFRVSRRIFGAEIDEKAHVKNSHSGELYNYHLLLGSLNRERL